MSAPRNTFRASQRLHGNGAFKRVIDGRARIDCGAISFHAIPRDAAVARTNDLTRMGISIGRRAGGAAVRNRFKRLLREAFRLSQHEHPTAAPAPYDLMVIVRAHDELTLAQYRAHLLDALQRLHAIWMKRMHRKINASDADARAAMPSASPSTTTPDAPDSPRAH